MKNAELVFFGFVAESLGLWLYGWISKCVAAEIRTGADIVKRDVAGTDEWIQGGL